jgi:hypothetical protein
LLCQVIGVANAKRESRVTEHLAKSAQIGCDDREPSSHIFRNYQAKDFATKRRHNHRTRDRQNGLHFDCIQTPRKTDARGELQASRKILKLGALGTVANDCEFE